MHFSEVDIYSDKDKQDESKEEPGQIFEKVSKLLATIFLTAVVLVWVFWNKIFFQGIGRALNIEVIKSTITGKVIILLQL